MIGQINISEDNKKLEFLKKVLQRQLIKEAQKQEILLILNYLENEYKNKSEDNKDEINLLYKYLLE